MRKWKKCLLLAAGMVVALSTAAMASQAKTGDTVTVEVKNKPGGVLQVYYEEDGRRVYLPVGEKVQLPKGTKLTAIKWGGEISWYSKRFDEEIESKTRNIYIKVKGKEECNYPVLNENGDTWIDWTVNNDCTLEAEYIAEQEIYDEGDEVTEVPNELRPYNISAKSQRYAGPQVAEVNLIARKGTQVLDLQDVPEVGLGYISRTNSSRKDDSDLFTIEGSQIRSLDELPVGNYSVWYHYKTRDTNSWYMNKHITIRIGKTVNAALHLGKYLDDENEIEYADAEHYPILNDENEGITSSIFDGLTTTTADIIDRYENGENFREKFTVFGFEPTGKYMDGKGEIIDPENPKLLKDATDSVAFYLVPELKKGDVRYEPTSINVIPDDEIITTYYNSWVEKNGKLFYYNESGELAYNEWTYRGGELVFCDELGALVTDGIAGDPTDEKGLWYVDTKGHRTNFTGEKTIGMMKYTIENGKVEKKEVVKVETPSNAVEVKNLVDGLRIYADDDIVLSEGEKSVLVDKLADGLSLLNSDQKNALHDTVIEKADEALKSVYGEYKADVICENESGEGEGFGEISPKGLLAAAGLNSQNDDNVTLKITRTDSNAAMKFDAKLYVGDSEDPTQLKSPVILDIEIPEDVQELYSKYGYTYKLVHVGDGKTESVGDGETKNGLSLELSQDMTSMRIRTSSFSTFELQAVRKTSDDGTVTPGEPEKPAKPSEPENPTKPEAPSKPTTPETPNKPNKGNSSSSDRDDSDSSSSGSSYRRTKSSPSGQWVQDAKGWWYRRADGSWPKSQWIELGWNGVNSWYYFNESGYMVTGWREDGGYTYYLNSVSDGTRGQMLTGWHQIDSIWYYFNKLTGGPQGSLVKNATTPDGYKVGADGAWLQ